MELFTLEELRDDGLHQVHRVQVQFEGMEVRIISRGCTERRAACQPEVQHAAKTPHSVRLACVLPAARSTAPRATAVFHCPPRTPPTHTRPKVATTPPDPGHEQGPAPGPGSSRAPATSSSHGPMYQASTHLFDSVYDLKKLLEVRRSPPSWDCAGTRARVALVWFLHTPGGGRLDGPRC